jgi:protein disulfide-isomerase/protein disulfide-isomerase A1
MFVRVLAFSACVSIAAADAVVSLTSKTFASHIKDNKQTLVEFYAPWCGHCKKLQPEFEKAATELQGRNIPLGQVDATVEKDLASKYNVKGFPTILWFEEGRNSEYDGGRTADSIVEWVSSMSGAAVIMASVAPEVTADKPRVVLYANDMMPGFEASAKQQRRKANWYYIKESGDSKVVLTHKDEAPVELPNPSGEDAISKFVNENAFPLFGKMDGESFDKYMDSNSGLVWSLFGGMDEGMTDKEVESKYRPMMSQVAKKWKGQYLVTYCDTEKFKEAIESLLGVKEFPAIAVQKKAGDKKKYIYRGELTANAINNFISNVDSGRETPYLKSDPVPADNDGAVRTVVGSTFNQEVFSPSKDVMLEVFAPWCGHCKKLEPEYQKYAEKIKEAKCEDMVTVAKMDGVTNDSPDDNFEWSSFPTIFFVKAGTRTPMKFEGERTYKGLLKFLKKHATKADEIRARLDKTKSKKGEEL